ncbi:hypothetical protein AAG906_031232 [Vitis piasezkii]
MIMRSLQPRFARHLMGFPHTDFGSLVQALYDLPRRRQGRTGFYYPPSPHMQYRSPALSRPMTPTYLHPISQLVFAAQKLMEGGLLTELAPRPVPQLMPPRFRMDLHCSYHRGLGHDTDHCVALRHAIQDLIDQASSIHFMDFTKLDNGIHMLSWDDYELEPIVVDESYEVDGVTLDSQASAPFRLVPDMPPLQLTTIWVSSFICPFGQWLCPEHLIPTFFNLLLGWPWIHRAGVIPPSLHQKVKFLHEGLVITIQSTGDTYSTFEPVLKISHGDDDLFLTGFTFDEIQTIKVDQFCRDHVVLPFDEPVDHDTHFGLGFVPTEVDYRYIALLRKERLRACLLYMPFDYPVCPYRMSLAYYFVMAPKTQMHSERITSRLSVDGALPCDEYSDEMFMVDMSQITNDVQPETTSPLDLFGVLVVVMVEDVQVVPTHGLLTIIAPDDDVFEGVTSPVMVEFEHVDPPLSFDYLPIFRNITLSAPHSPTSQIFDIDDEIVQHDLDDDSSSASDSSPSDQGVSPTIGDTEIVDFGTADQPRELRIGLDLSTDERDGLAQLFRSYLDVFAWSYEDMTGLDPSMVQHHLPFLPHVRPVKQKLRRLHPRWSLQVKKEIQKQLNVGFLLVIEYPEWLANVVLVPKKDGKVRVYVDFRDLNKANPKDDFPLPHIDMLVDCTAGHSILSFMDGFSKYNKILMALKIWRRRFSLPNGCQRAFERIREYLLSLPVLVPPTPGRPLLLYLSVSNIALGCMLAQLDDSGKERAIYYLSKRMLDYETRYVMIEHFCLALFWATRRLRHYMTEYLVHLISRLDSLRYLFDRPTLIDQLMRWLVLLTEFNIHYATQKDIDDDFPSEDIVAVTSLSSWRIYVRLAFFDQHPTTNNIVEYEACILGLETTLELGIRQMEVFGDSNLNQFVDALATLPSMIDIPVNTVVRHLLIESRSIHVYCCLIDEAELDDGLPWYHDIYQFFRLGIYPEFVERCPKCQIHRELIHIPPSELHISPKSSSGHEFIFVTMDYFTKWVKVASYRYDIQHHRLSTYRPQTNGAIEATNKNIKMILQRMIDTSRDWSEKLPFALWAYWISFRTSTKVTPYFLVYGMEVVLPVEI